MAPLQEPDGRVYHLGDIIKTGREGLGNEAEAYDAEMLALANGLCDAIEIAKEVMSSDPSIHHTNITLIADNTLAVHTIAQAKPGTRRGVPRRLLETAFDFLDAGEHDPIRVEWTPGHHTIAGNDRADAEAEAAFQEAPTSTKTALSHFYGTLQASFEKQWTNQWALYPKRGQIRHIRRPITLCERKSRLPHS